MTKKYLPSIVLIGWALLVIGILFDDVTTLILFSFGFKIAETNPFIVFGLPYSFLLLVYLFFGWAWYYINKITIEKYKKKQKGYKIQDITLFLVCFSMVFITVNKIDAGINNVSIMIDYIQDKEQVIDKLEQLSILRDNNIEDYNKTLLEYYKAEIFYIHYYKVILMLLGTFLLFKTGYEVRPWGVK